MVDVDVLQGVDGMRSIERCVDGMRSIERCVDGTNRSRDVWMVPKEKMKDVLAPYEEEVHKFTQTRVNVNLP